jgi:hypothetical protein
MQVNSKLSGRNLRKLCGFGAVAVVALIVLLVQFEVFRYEGL